MTRDDDPDPTYYVAGQAVRIRGVEFEQAQARGGGTYTDVSVHVQFPETPKTTQVPTGVLKVDGGLAAFYDDMVARGMLPEWVGDGDPPPWERADQDDGGGDDGDD
jgi:hypothetical protein